MENVIYNELRMRGYSVDVGVIPIAERDQDGKVIRKQLEVDFVCQKPNKTIYIQVSESILDETTRNREFKSLEKINDNYIKYILTLDNWDYSKNGIIHLNIIDFLKDTSI